MAQAEVHRQSPRATVLVEVLVFSSLDLIQVKDTKQQLIRILVIEDCVSRTHECRTRIDFTFPETSVIVNVGAPIRDSGQIP